MKTSFGTCPDHFWQLDTIGGQINFFKRVEKKPFLAVATLWFINIILLLLDLVYHNCILFDFTDVNNNNNNNIYDNA